MFGSCRYVCTARAAAAEGHPAPSGPDQEEQGWGQIMSAPFCPSLPTPAGLQAFQEPFLLIPGDVWPQEGNGRGLARREEEVGHRTPEWERCQQEKPRAVMSRGDEVLGWG